MLVRKNVPIKQNDWLKNIDYVEYYFGIHRTIVFLNKLTSLASLAVLVPSLKPL